MKPFRSLLQITPKDDKSVLFKCLFNKELKKIQVCLEGLLYVYIINDLNFKD